MELPSNSSLHTRTQSETGSAGLTTPNVVSVSAPPPQAVSPEIKATINESKIKILTFFRLSIIVIVFILEDFHDPGSNMNYPEIWCPTEPISIITVLTMYITLTCNNHFIKACRAM